MKKLLLTLLLASQSIFNAVNYPLVYMPEGLEHACVALDTDRKYHIFGENISIDIQNCDVDPMIRNASGEHLYSFFEKGGYLIVDQFSDGEFYIKAKMRLLGGGNGNDEDIIGDYLRRSQEKADMEAAMEKAALNAAIDAQDRIKRDKAYKKYGAKPSPETKEISYLPAQLASGCTVAVGGFLSAACPPVALFLMLTGGGLALEAVVFEKIENNKRKPIIRKEQKKIDREWEAHKQAVDERWPIEKELKKLRAHRIARAELIRELQEEQERDLLPD